MKNDLDPRLIGKIVILQTFVRRTDHSSELVPDSETKFVGTLLGYSLNADVNAFILQGAEPVELPTKTHYFEIHIPSEVREVSTTPSLAPVLHKLIFKTHKDASNLINELNRIMDLYGKITIADLYDATGIISTFNDNQWGWSTRLNITIETIDNGFMLRLPSPIKLDN